MSEVLLDGGTIEEIITDCGVYKRNNVGSYYKLSENGKYYIDSGFKIKKAMEDYQKSEIKNINFMNNNNKFGWTEKRTFEKYYKEQLIRLYKKVSPYKCLSFLNNVSTIEEVSFEMDKLISEMGK